MCVWLCILGWLLQRCNHLQPFQDQAPESRSGLVFHCIGSEDDAHGPPLQAAPVRARNRSEKLGFLALRFGRALAVGTRPHHDAAAHVSDSCVRAPVRVDSKARSIVPSPSPKTLFGGRGGIHPMRET